MYLVATAASIHHTHLPGKMMIGRNFCLAVALMALMAPSPDTRHMGTLLHPPYTLMIDDVMMMPLCQQSPFDEKSSV